MKLIKAKKYLIYWEDTFSFSGWWNDDKIKERSEEMNYYMETLGFYCGEYYGFVAFAQQYNNGKFGTSKWGHITWITRGCKKRIKKVKI